VLVSHEHRFIFVKTRKTAGTSLEIGLARFLGPHDLATAIAPEDEALGAEWGHRSRNVRIPVRKWRLNEIKRLIRSRPVVFFDHMPATMIRRLLPEAWQDYYTFTVERNPYEIAVSAYFWARRHWALGDITLSEFIHSSHLPRYSNWRLYSDGDDVIVDRIVQYQRLNEELVHLADQLGLPEIKIPRAKGRYRTHGPSPSEMLTPGDRARIEAVFAHELELFSYTL
jgi:hypothetical protein